MAQLMEYAEYLSKEIGPRPAGTEEEQQAALYITEQFQKDSGFTAQIEEFTSSSNLEGLSAIPGAVVIVVAILAIIFPILSIPAFILAAIAAAIYTLEAFGRPVVTRMLARGASQNVVAKYQPNPDVAHEGRSRKIVLVAYYDSAKVTPPLVQRIESLKLPVPIGLVCVAGMVLAAFLLLVHVFANSGVAGVIVDVLIVIALVICAYPVLRAILLRTAPYNEGANNNASGTAALLEVARRISRGSVSEADLADIAGADGVRIHGELAARESGLVPEGAQIRYEAEQLVPPAELGNYDEEERLLSAKAAIAALTGQPVERRVYGSAARKLVNSRAHGEDPAAPASAADAAAVVEAAAEPAVAGAAIPVSENASASQLGVAVSAAEASPAESAALESALAPAQPAASIAASATAQTAASSEVDGYKNAPSWFVAAQQNAKRPTGETGPVQRSRYASAIEAAEQEMAERERARQEQERQQREAELRAREEAARAAIAASALASEAPANGAASAEAAGAEAAGAEAAADANAAAPAPQASRRGALRAPAAEGDEPQPQDSRRGALRAPAAEGDEPVFTPYKPADDAFAASLGRTTAFQPVDHDAAQAAAAAAAGDAALPAEAEEPGIDAAPQPEAPNPRLADLPAINRTENLSPSRSGMFRKLRTDVPSMSGVIRMQAAGEDVSQLPVQQPAPHSVGTAGIDGAYPGASGGDAGAPQVPAAPVPPAADRPDYDMPLDEAPAYDADFADAVDYGSDYGNASGNAYDNGNDYDYDYDNDDSHYEPSSVEMPKSRAGGFFSRFRRKNREDLEETPQEWLDVDEDFDARTVGRKRGGWESFREDADADAGAGADANVAADSSTSAPRPRHGRTWEGGAASRLRLGHVSTRSEADSDTAISDDPHNTADDHQIADEIEQIYHFRNPLYNTEVWFVALGSDTAAHDGAKAFIAEHADELRGSMVIEIESLGAGELCVASEEGRVTGVTTSSRVKRYTRAASAATGVVPGNVSLAGSDSAASTFQKAGYQVMHLLGVEDGHPALKGSPDDILENIDDLLLDDHVNFLMELLKK